MGRNMKSFKDQTIDEMANELARNADKPMYKNGKLTAYGRRMSKFLERALPDEKVDE